MTSKNHFELRGFVGAQVEIKTTEKGKKIVNLSIATNQIYTDKKGEKVENTLWHSVTLWDKKAELAEKHINKGALVSVEGKIKPRSYNDNEGVKKYTIDLVVDRLDIILNKES